VLQPRSAEKSLKPYFGGSRSFSVINIESLKACQQLLLR